MKHILVGKTITGLKITEDKMDLLFMTDGGDILVRCDADCCSETWIEHIEMPTFGFPAKVISAENLEMPDLGDMPGREVIQYYGFKIVTDKGEIVIDYRNDSNGYYGGNLFWPSDDYFYGGVHGQNISNEIWIDVVKDI